MEPQDRTGSPRAPAKGRREGAAALRLAQRPRLPGPAARELRGRVAALLGGGESSRRDPVSTDVRRAAPRRQRRDDHREGPGDRGHVREGRAVSRQGRRPPRRTSRRRCPSSRTRRSSTDWCRSRASRSPRKPITCETPLWQTLLMYLGPALLFGLLVPVHAQGGRRRDEAFSFGARGRRSTSRRRSASRSRTSRASRRPSRSSRRSSTSSATPAKYTKLGARIPRGVLSGSPNGSIAVARAVAGEAGVPFFSMSASEFVEMIVGVGAPVCATCSHRRRRPLLRSSSSTRSTRSGDRGSGPSAAPTTSESRP